MSSDIQIPENLSDEEKYIELNKTASVFFAEADPLITQMSNFAALLKQSFEKISWVGFYLYNGERLILGPFQGKVACTAIALGKGVCGTAAVTKETQVVPNVHEFPGHIACDSGSNSEIVIPILTGTGLFGVLDLDSYKFNAFDDTDKKYLEELMRQFAELVSGSDTRKLY
ncbi:MAG: GAF domain-containing protein [Ignavibacteria bacterium]|nr:GAF domain-containing protein [Ignavibacteria bacterium]